ncbi:MAG: hypothetical protein MSS28_02605 [Tenericutes bacterium]|nr:hypothetical protein [Mycoplasmatota bacterium]
MKKVIVLLSIVLLLMTGCSIKKLDDKDFESNMNVLLSEKVSNSNVNFEGYKYYVPEGLKFVNKEEYNAIFKDRFNNKYYLYVDVISYYHKIENTYKINQDAYYSKVIDYNDKTGYLEIIESGSKYYVEFMFNYAKIEVLVDKDQLVNAMNNMCYILRSIKFNDKVLESLVGDNVLSYTEENFTLFDKTPTRSDVLEVTAGEGEKYKVAKDQEILDLDEE